MRCALRDRRRLRILGFTIGVLPALLAGCGPRSDGLMVAVPPPAGWKDRVLTGRAEKDELFRHDPETPLLPADVGTFNGLEYWTLDPKYRLVGPLHVYENPERFEIATTSGKMRPCERYGWLAFRLDGRHLTLQVYRLLDSPDQQDAGFFVPFTDRTTGHETYPAGRYVDLEGEPGGLYVLDFNTAYNPLCAYGAPERYVCPVTPSENRLPVRIEAGERGYKKTSGATS